MKDIYLDLKKLIEVGILSEEDVEFLIHEPEDSEVKVKCSFCNDDAMMAYYPENEKQAKPLLVSCLIHYYQFIEEIKKRTMNCA